MRSALLLFLFFASLASVLAGFMLGSVAASLEDLLDAISGKDNIKGYIILNVRVPRTLGAYVGGAALALSGLMLQTYFRNPLAGPYVLGISSAASLGVALYVLAGVGWSYYGLVGSSMLGSLVAILFVLVLASRVRSAVTLLIAGLMFGYVFGAVERILITFAESRQVHEFVLWTFGSFSGVTWDDLRIFSALVLISIMLSVALAKPLNAMLLGEEYARSMGVDVRAVRVAVVTMSSFLAALVTAFAGIVAFIGLAVPHIVRMLFRTSDHRVLIPAVSVCGAFITVICDIVARTIASPVELPISVVTSLFGAPIVVLLIMKRRRVG
ncbi:MAG: iron ABC transporter permease [Archaeoglobi archaeon]|nr:iron ABC transporter permease [Archaeoglobi archaeon]